jgi:8-oxo-dGTP pyrophosphatase MutT (NUDIX family)
MTCCQLYILPNKGEEEVTDNFTLVQRKFPRGRRVRAGTIIVDFRTRKLLIIQCYHKLWGLPKGHVESGETVEQCAVRETFEETGIRIELNDLMNKYTIYNGDGIYYVVDGTRLDYNLSNIPTDQKEITGITWICMNCFERLLKTGQLHINSHLKHLLPYIYKELWCAKEDELHPEIQADQVQTGLTLNA